MSNSIILFSSLFGSVYLMTISLGLINSSFLENKKIPRKLIIINGLTFVASSSIFIGVTLSNMSYFKSSRV
jgi:ABC-type Na+ efflux pump permease subunit